MKHAILGAGAIGGLMGTTLAALGENVTLIVRPEKLATYPDEIVLEQPNRTVVASASHVSRLSEHVNVLWIATKTYQLESALASIESAPGAVVPLLNGIDHIAVLRAHFGHDCVLPATIAVGADRLAEGRFWQGSAVRLSVAATGQPLLDETLRRLHERFGFICGFVENEETLLWAKLSFLAPFALTTAASGLDKGRILSDPSWRSDFYGAVAETLAVARAEGAEVKPSHVDDVLAGSPDTMRSSLAKDLAAGRPVELNGIAGPIIHGGAKHGIPVPTTAKLMKIIREKAAARTS
jgi:2-dehydropantoate 2-reductase